MLDYDFIILSEIKSNLQANTKPRQSLVLGRKTSW